MSDTPTPSLGDKIMAAASRHYHSLGPRKIEVPEWECSIWFKPVNVTEQQAYLREAAFNGGTEHAYVKAIIDKAMDENGTKLFTLEHRMALLHASYGEVVRRVGEAILSTRHEPLKRDKGESQQEAIEKN